MQFAAEVIEDMSALYSTVALVLGDAVSFNVKNGILVDLPMPLPLSCMPYGGTIAFVPHMVDYCRV